MQNDWRITNQINYLFRAKLKKVQFTKTSHSDHEHCEFCWDKFGAEEGMLHSGYCTLDEYRWICEQCFQDFKDQFEWQVYELPKDTTKYNCL